MKAVAFLQNMWMRDPSRTMAMFKRHGDGFRLELMRRMLFAGCLTGRRLKASFGDLCSEIVWEETTREVAGDAKTIFPAQPEHIRQALQLHKPDVVLTFGRIAEAAVKPLWQGILICAPHPAARQPETRQKLMDAAFAFRAMRPPQTPV